MTKCIRIHIPAVALLLGGFTVLTHRALAQSGVPLWTNYSVVYPQNLTLTTDNNGNVIVAGTAYPAFNDYATVKISSSGVSLWTNGFSSPGDKLDVASAVAVDSANNVFVTGYGTYSALDTDYVTIKYSSGGIPLWTNRYNGPAGSYDAAASMMVDTADNVLVTGTSRGTGGNNEWATVKYSNSGTLEWVQRYGDPGSAHAWAVSVGVDSTNVYVAGYNAAGEFATLAYSSVNGTPLWTNNYGPGYVARAQEIAADNNGHVFVTGYASKHDTPQFDQDYVTLAYSSAGAPLWTNRFEGLGLNFDNDDRAVGLAVSHGNVFVLGSSMGSDSYQDFATVAYSTAGATRWVNRFSGDWGHDFPAAIAADSDGNVFVTGLRGDAALNTSYYVTLAYSLIGGRLWSHEIRYDVITPTEIAVDTSRNVFVTGYGVSGGVTLKYAAFNLPYLVFQFLNGQLVISWTSLGCTLQSSPNVAGPYMDIPGATSPYTTSTSGDQQFFRLKCN